MIDAHHHFWSVARGDYGWLTPDLPICRDYGPRHLAPLLAGTGIERTILIQAAPTEAETEYLLGLAATTPLVAGVVGWVDFDAADAAARVHKMADKAKIVGLRPMLQDISDDEWLLRRSLAPAWAAMVERGLSLDALVKPRHLGVLLRFLDRHPDLQIVIDHGAKPDIARGARETWASDLAAIAKGTAARCKLSGLATEAAPRWSLDDIRPYVDHLLDMFGAPRLMWGSDWPVLELNGCYARWFEACQRLTAHLGMVDRALLFGGTAREFYRLGPEASGKDISNAA